MGETLKIPKSSGGEPNNPLDCLAVGNPSEGFPAAGLAVSPYLSLIKKRAGKTPASSLRVYSSCPPLRKLYVLCGNHNTVMEGIDDHSAALVRVLQHNLL